MYLMSSAASGFVLCINRLKTDSVASDDSGLLTTSSSSSSALSEGEEEPVKKMRSAKNPKAVNAMRRKLVSESAKCA